MGVTSSLVQKAISNPSAMIGNGVNAAFSVNEYKGYRKEGDGIAVSAAKAAGSFAYGELANMAGIAITGTAGLPAALIGMGIMLAPAAASISKQMFEYNGSVMAQGYDSVGKFGSGSSILNSAGYTMRQRSLNAIRSNGLNTSSALGNEARNYYLGSIS